MSLSVKSNYQNPLEMMNNKIGDFNKYKGKDTDDVQKLSDEKQRIENSIIVIKSTGSDNPEASEKILENLQEKLDKVSGELKKAKNTNNSPAEIQASQAAENLDKSNPIKPDLYSSPRFDIYEKNTQQSINAGIYSLERGEQNKYNINFNPYELI